MIGEAPCIDPNKLLIMVKEEHMNMTPHQEKVLQQYQKQEMLLSRLYSIFARLFPEFKEFWEKLSLEEDRHARLVEKLSQAAKKGLVSFEEGRVKTFALDTFIKRLEMLIKNAEKGVFTVRSAFSVAVDFETSLIEKKVFTRFVALNTKNKKILQLLNLETLEHIERVKKTQRTLGL
jgi:hypothetical protein